MINSTANQTTILRWEIEMSEEIKTENLTFYIILHFS